MERWVWIDGAVVPVGGPVVAADDRALLLGEGVFETCGVIDGAPFALGRHLLRLRASADRLGIALPWPDQDIRRACGEVIDAAGIEGGGRPGSPDGPLRLGGVTARLRITVTAGRAEPDPATDVAPPRLLVMVGPAPQRGPSADVVTVPWPVNERGALAGVKTTSRAELALASSEAGRRGGDEAILVNTAGHLCEGSGSNLFLAVGGRLVTPGLASGCLAGVIRGLVLELADVVERDDLTIEDLRRSPEAFLTSSIRGVHPIRTVDGQPLRAVMGPLTTAAARSHASLVGRTLDP